MTQLAYIGNAFPTTDVWTFVISGAASPDTNAAIATALQALLAASAYPEFLEYTWTVNSATITATANTPGIPGIFTESSSGGATWSIICNGKTVSAVGSGSGTPVVTMSHAIAATGPNDVDNPLNYSTGSLPISTNTLIIPNGCPALLYNLTALSAVTLAVRQIQAGCGQIGLPSMNPNGYPEYRPQYLKLPATIDLVNTGVGQNTANFINLDASSVATTMTAYGGVVNWKGTNSGNTIINAGASLNIAPLGSDIADISVLKNTGGTTLVPYWVVPGTVTQTGGTLQLDNAASTSITCNGGTLNLNGTSGGAFSPLVLANGTVCNFAYTGALTFITVGSGTTLNASGLTASGVGSILMAGGQVIDPGNVLQPINGYYQSSGRGIQSI